jgi:hypothetical protein
MHNLIVLWALKYNVYITDVYHSDLISEHSACIFLFFSVRLATEVPISKDGMCLSYKKRGVHDTGQIYSSIN